MTTQAVREYLAHLWNQYHKGTRAIKSEILNEISRNLKVHRKSAIRLMNSRYAPKSLQGYRGGRLRQYSEEAKTHLAHLWHKMGYMCPIRMKAALPAWLPFYEHKDCNEGIKEELHAMSESSIKRFLTNERAKLRRKVNTGTRPGLRRFVTQVPIRNLEDHPKVPGHCEIDCVAHCGNTMSGQFAWTLTLTDIATGWTECEALWEKTGVGVKKALTHIETRLPFRLKGLYFDNGAEFMNRDIIDVFAVEKRKAPVPVYRGRPRRKNDQCYVEQKNFTHVRSLFGYGRISWEPAVKMMNAIYRREWTNLQNFFHPQQQLVEKVRIGAKIVRRMGKPSTPFDKLLPFLDPHELRRLAQKKKEIDPIRTRDDQRYKTRKIFNNIKSNYHFSEWGKMAL